MSRRRADPSAFGYFRLGSGVALPVQAGWRRSLTVLADRYGLLLVEVFSDDHTRPGRPSLVAMVDAVTTYGIAAVLVPSLSHLGSDVQSQRETVQWIRNTTHRPLYIAGSARWPAPGTTRPKERRDVLGRLWDE